MKKVFLLTTRTIATVAIIAMFATISNAQTSFGPGGPGVATVNGGFGAPPNDVPGGSGVPFDGGLSLVLLASGVAFSAKKIKASKANVA